MTDVGERNVRIPCSHGWLEGMYRGGACPTDGALVAHPHPLMGGTMRNGVVRAVADSLAACGFSTLCFNFRGVENSTGSFDNGIGEQDDVLAAVSFLEAEIHRRPLVAGYSFGAWVASRTAARLDGCRMLLVAPPFAMFDFDAPSLAGKIGLIIAAQNDAFCPVGKIRVMAEQIECDLRIVPDADHFFSDQEMALKTTIREYYGHRP